MSTYSGVSSVWSGSLLRSSDTFWDQSAESATVQSSIDNGIVVPAGELVDFHYVHFDPVGFGSVPNLPVALSGEFTFPSDILGVIVLLEHLKESDFLVNGPTTYRIDPNSPLGDPQPTLDLIAGLPASGMEIAPEHDIITLQPDKRTLIVDLTALSPGDNIRVITAAAGPLPLLVTKTADTDDGICDSDCSIREAVGAANPGDTIIVPKGVYTLTLNQTLFIDKDLKLREHSAFLTKGAALDPSWLSVCNGQRPSGRSCCTWRIVKLASRWPAPRTTRHRSA